MLILTGRRFSHINSEHLHIYPQTGNKQLQKQNASVNRWPVIKFLSLSSLNTLQTPRKVYPAHRLMASCVHPQNNNI